MQPSPLPAALADSPFSVREALSRGVSPARLRARDLTRPMHGVRLTSAAATLEGRAAALAVVLPVGSAFSHQTAGHLLGLPMPRGCDARTLHIMVQTRLSQVCRHGVDSHRGLETRALRTVNGTLVVAEAATWCDLAGPLAIDDLVVIGDHIARRSANGIEQLAGEAASRVRRRYARKIRAALANVRPASASPMETITRLVLVRGGIREPELNCDISDDLGGWIARGDFVWRPERLVLEYDGSQHRLNEQQWRSDLIRRRNLEDAGWRVEVVTADDVLRLPDAMVSRIGRLLRERSGRPAGRAA